jgi:NmrA-like family
MRVLWVMLLILYCVCCISSSSSSVVAGKILVVGATGTTGIRALRGLLDVYPPHDLTVLTRNANQRRVLQLKEMGLGVLQADLEDEESLRKELLRHYHHQEEKGNSIWWEGCYIHSTSSDTPDLDTLEVPRAQNLCRVLVEIAQQQQQQNRKRQQQEEEETDGGGSKMEVPLVVVYNSAAACPDHGVRRIAQKHQVEDVMKQAAAAAQPALASSDDNSSSAAAAPFPTPPLIFVSLRANIFMEELWKKYTRPSILNGTYPLPVNFWTPIYLTSVRDMGRLAALWIERHGVVVLFPNNKAPLHCKSQPPTCLIQNVAGDCLRGPQIAKAFAQAQESPCRYIHNREFTQQAKASFPELYEQIVYVRNNHKEKTDIRALRRQIPSSTRYATTTTWSMTSFAEFLKETEWGNRDLTFEDLSRVELLSENVAA